MSTPLPPFTGLDHVRHLIMFVLLVLLGTWIFTSTMNQIGGNGQYEQNCTETLYDTTSSKPDAHDICVQFGFEDEYGNQLDENGRPIIR